MGVYFAQVCFSGNGPPADDTAECEYGLRYIDGRRQRSCPRHTSDHNRCHLGDERFGMESNSREIVDATAVWVWTAVYRRVSTAVLPASHERSQQMPFGG
ncbi:hypothetical protein J6590_001941 [Homalodisca vitripennis]|nr:hypothetical protein J6590_001941 [Homalodisca vitripennis]